MYLVGSNNRETRFRLLTINRTPSDESDLKIYEYPSEYSSRDIRQILGNLGTAKVTSAYGVLGFVRFLEGYYLILVTKRTKCAFIGNHPIYTIKDTVMIKVNQPLPSGKNQHPFEQRYLKMFQNIDLKSNFYFSYSYDLTRTLQHNLSAPRYVNPEPSYIDIENDEPFPEFTSTEDYAYRINSRKRFVWNAFLLKPMQNIILKDWLLEITHGYLSQSCMNIFGRPLYMLLLARRSSRFAGTRFLKRGANFNGDVANEVETEQVVQDGSRLCSFTQMRGSIPSHWSQDISKMVPKPAIGVDLSDPFSQTPAKHFQRLLFHFGSPVIVFNLVKKRERRKHESILSKEVTMSIKYLNQFLPPQHKIKYVHFDMARKSKEKNVMENLAEIAETLVNQVGIFSVERNEVLQFQNGIIRTNCVDCLDRTNTAQFTIAKYALGYQLYHLGFLQSPKLLFDSECVNLLEGLFEDHGDTLALQYGGSQLVHRIKTYRKTAAWASQGNDIMQTLSRYYSNTFSDTEKQHAINLFLGYYVPSRILPAIPIWELQTDYYMHNLVKSVERTSLTNWVRLKIRESLPNSASDSHKIVKQFFSVQNPSDFEMIDSFSNYYASFKFTEFQDDIAFQIAQMAYKFLPKIRGSPFLPGRKRGDQPHPPLTFGQSSTGSAASDSSSENDSSSSDEEFSTSISNNISSVNSPQSQNQYCESFTSQLESASELNITISNKSMELFKDYVKINKISSYPDEGRKASKTFEIKVLSKFSNDSYESVKPPTVKETDIAIYADYIKSMKKVECGFPDRTLFTSCKPFCGFDLKI